MRKKNITNAMTKDMVAHALLALMEEYPYQKITISDIAKKAEVDRSTYYRNFHSKEDIIEYFFDRILQEFLDSFSDFSSIDYTIYFYSIFSIFYAYKKEVLLIYKTSLASCLLEALSKRFRFSQYSEEAPVPKQYEISYIIGGIYNCLMLWMARDMEETPEQMSEIALRFRNEDSLMLLNLHHSA